MGKYLILFIFFLTSGFLFSQQTKRDSIAVKKADSLSANLKTKGIVAEEISFQKPFNPLAPSKAAFLSAILPGLGQIYNKRYWKAPIAWGLVGIGIFNYSDRNTSFNRFRDAFKRRRAGFIDDDDFAQFSDSALQDAQEQFQGERDLWLIFTIAMYALNIIDANVDAHLKQYNIDNKLSMDFKPFLNYNEVSAQPNYGMALVIKF